MDLLAPLIYIGEIRNLNKSLKTFASGWDQATNLSNNVEHAVQERPLNKDSSQFSSKGRTQQNGIINAILLNSFHT